MFRLNNKKKGENMKSYTVKMSKTYDFEVEVEANSAETAKKMLIDTPFEKLTNALVSFSKGVSISIFFAVSAELASTSTSKS